MDDRKRVILEDMDDKYDMVMRGREGQGHSTREERKRAACTSDSRRKAGTGRGRLPSSEPHQ